MPYTKKKILKEVKQTTYTNHFLKVQSDVCQIRLDYDAHSTAAPSDSEPAGVCTTDYFQA